MPKSKPFPPVSNKTLLYFGAALLAVTAIYVAFTSNLPMRTIRSEKKGSQIDTQVTRANCLADDCLAVEDLAYPVDDLPEEMQQALNMAIEDEYKALSTYEAVLAKYGQVRPFSIIKGAEEQHIASLKALFDKYGLNVPTNTWRNSVTVPISVKQACQIGADAEIANAALYREKLLPAVTEYEDITAVFTKLMNASQQKHLSAFERCK